MACCHQTYFLIKDTIILKNFVWEWMQILNVILLQQDFKRIYTLPNKILLPNASMRRRHPAGHSRYYHGQDTMLEQTYISLLRKPIMASQVELPDKTWFRLWTFLIKSQSSQEMGWLIGGQWVLWSLGNQAVHSTVQSCPTGARTMPYSCKSAGSISQVFKAILHTRVLIIILALRRPPQQSNLSKHPTLTGTKSIYVIPWRQHVFTMLLPQTNAVNSALYCVCVRVF